MADLPEQMVALGSSRSVIRELAEYGWQRAAQVGADNVFDFSIGNPSVPPPQQGTDTILDLVQHTDPIALHGYTSSPGDMACKEQLAASLTRRFGMTHRADNVYIVAGAASALCCCFKGLTLPGDEYVTITPCFVEYGVYCAGAGGVLRTVSADTATFQPDFAALEAAITPRTKGVLVNSPNNPSGAVYGEETVRRLADLLSAKSAQYGHPIYLIADEPYREIVYDGVTVPYLPKYYPDTLVCYSFSKSLSLPGERLGYVVVPDSVTDSRRVYAAVCGAGRSMGYVNAPSLFQRVCARCADLTADISVYEKNRNLLYDCLTSLGFEVTKPAGTFYIFPRALEPDAAAFSERAKAHDILLVPGDGFGCPGFVRISYCVPTQRVERSLDAFAALAAEYR